MRRIKDYNKNKIYVITIIFLFTLFLSFKGFAMNSHSHGTIILLGNKNLTPIIYSDDGVAKGIAVDIAKAIGNEIGYDIEVMAMDWELAQIIVLNGDADGLLHMNPSFERNRLYDFSFPLLKSEFSIFVLDNNVSIRDINDLKGKRVGVEPGGYPSILLLEYDGIEMEVIYDWDTSFRDIISGDLDAIIVDRWIGEYELAQSKISGIKIIEKPVETQYSRIAVKKGDTKTFSLINSGLRKIIEDGTVDKIMEEWKGKRVLYITEDYYRSFLLHSAILFLTLITLISIYFVTKYRRLSKSLEISVKERTEELHQANEMLKAANSKLERISMVDGLTSIENRRAFDIAYNKTWKLCLRERMPLTLIMIDIDYFKIFNDTYGHLIGDEALIKIAKVIKNVIKRPGDLAARYGGEEFVVMLMNTTIEGGKVVAEEIKKRIEELGIENREIKNVITVSLGVASVIPNYKIEPKELIDYADRALYRAKECGRNKVIVWKDDI